MNSRKEAQHHVILIIPELIDKYTLILIMTAAGLGRWCSQLRVCLPSIETYVYTPESMGKAGHGSPYS